MLILTLLISQGSMVRSLFKSKCRVVTRRVGNIGMDNNIDSLIAELKWDVPEPDLARLKDIYEKIISTLTLGFDPSVLIVLDNEDAHQQEIERIKFRIKENIVARLMARANSVVMFGKIKSGDASSFTKVVLRMGMKTAKIYILALALFLLDPALEPLAAKSFSRAILGRLLAEELGFKSTMAERVEMGGLLLEIGRIPMILYEIKESTTLDERFTSTYNPLLGLIVLRKYELPDYLEDVLLHSHLSFLHRSLSPRGVIGLADLAVKDSFSRYGKLLFESPLPDATIESTLGSSILDQFSAVGYRKYVELRRT